METMTQKQVSNMEDILDSRDIIERLSELEEMEGERDEDEVQELITLKALVDEAGGSPDWEHGEQLIRYSYFKEYAQELAEDCGMIQREVNWPYTCIDWDHAVSELKMDYMCIDFDGIEYWIRA